MAEEQEECKQVLESLFEAGEPESFLESFVRAVIVPDWKDA
jgi:hypothetical protein